MKVLSTFLAAVLSICSASVPCFAAKPEPLLVVTNVNIVDVRTGEILRNHNVIIRGERIEHIAKVALVGRSRNVQIINAGGKYLIPGLWDMHVHSTGGPAASWNENIIYPLYVANGITGIRDMGGDLKLLQERRKKIEQGSLIGPTMVYAGPFLARGKPDAQVINAETPEAARQAVDNLKREGVDFVKVLELSHDAFLAVAEESHQQRIPFAGHISDSVSAWDAANAGMASIEHLRGIPLACSSREQELREQRTQAAAEHDGKAYEAAAVQTLATYDPQKAHRLFSLFIEKNVWQTPTLVWTDIQSRLDDPKLAGDDRLRYVPDSIRKSWDDEMANAQKNSAELASAKDAMPKYLQITRDMFHDGVLLLAGSDGPDPFVIPGFSLHTELEMLAKAGTSNVEALRAATIRPAKFIGKGDRVGIIERGWTADLVLLDANPLENIRNTQKISGVFLRGRYFSRQELDKLLAEIESRAKTE